MSPMLFTLVCLVAVLVIMSIGDIVSTATKAFVPSVFVAAVLFLIGFWQGWLPMDVVDKAQMGGMIANVSMYLLIAHMGTLMSFRELCQEWKSVAIAVAGLAGMCAALLYGGTQLIDRNAIIAGTPPLSGGILAAIIMSKAAADKGMALWSVMALLIYIVQGFVGYPITALCLKSEGKRLLRLRAEGHTFEAKGAESGGRGGFHLIPPKYQTAYTHLACAAIIGLVSQFATEQLNKVLANFTTFGMHPLVVCLIFGAIAAELGLVERKPLLRHADADGPVDEVGGDRDRYPVRGAGAVGVVDAAVEEDERVGEVEPAVAAGVARGKGGEGGESKNHECECLSHGEYYTIFMAHSSQLVDSYNTRICSGLRPSPTVSDVVANKSVC